MRQRHTTLLSARLHLPAVAIIAAILPHSPLSAIDGTPSTQPTPQPASSSTGRPNFLLIALDDLIPLYLPERESDNDLLRQLVPDRSARRALVQAVAPNISRLADRGITFTRAYSPAPRCAPSRAATLTGIAPARSGFVDVFRDHFRSAPGLAKAVTLPQLLKQNGYQTLGIGKLFHGAAAERDRTTFQISRDWPDTQLSWTGFLETNTESHGDVIRSWASGSRKLRVFGEDLLPSNLQPDWLNADRAAQLLLSGSASAQPPIGPVQSIHLIPEMPFLLAVGFSRPHTPWTVPRDWLNALPSRRLRHLTIDLRGELADLGDLPAEAHKILNFAPHNNKYGSVGGTFHFKPDKVRTASAHRRLHEAIRHYLANLALADACVGQVLNALSESRYASNTTVILWSDHGVHLGRKLHLGKTTLWEPSLRSVLIIADPQSPSRTRGTRDDAPVSLVDIYPTVAQLANLTPPYRLDGTSLTPVLQGAKGDPDRIIVSMMSKDYAAVIAGDWKYISYGSPRRAELYHLASDPHERINRLFASTKRDRIVSRHLHSLLNKEISPGGARKD